MAGSCIDADGRSGSSLSTVSKQISFLTLGDGDMSFSVDAGEWLRGERERLTGGNSPNYKLIASGIDSREEMKKKYKDCTFFFSKLEALNTVVDLDVKVKHELNALDPPTEDPTLQVDHVIFNHPHIGTEDAARHSRFLCHFFHACRNFWMKPGAGTVHLTLVDGQFERWKAANAAKRHDLVLVCQSRFQLPPVPKPCFEQRRHQTGKSFASRATKGSWTFSFARKEDENLTEIPKVDRILPWINLEVHSKPTGEAEDELTRKHNHFSCSQCERSFREERSLKAHMKSVHAGGRKRKQSDPIYCPYCSKTEDGSLARTFAHDQSLQDHIRAKHGNRHNTILPEWTAKRVDAEQPKGRDSTKYGRCDICDLSFSSLRERDFHSKEFIPLPVSSQQESLFQCTFCSKAFGSLRARLQHENFCSSTRCQAVVE